MKSSGQAQWEDAYPVASSTMEFSFVNARGNDVWAGGSHASLIHSRDGGQTWETIKLGDNASGTIVSIIAGTMSVQVKTSDNQTWSSADGGKTWSRCASKRSFITAFASESASRFARGKKITALSPCPLTLRAL